MFDHEFPILEYDPCREAVTGPHIPAHAGFPERVVGCFYQHAIDTLVESGSARLRFSLGSTMGKHPLYEVDAFGAKVGVFQPGLGASLSAGFLEEVISLGGRRFIFAGSCGVLDSSIPRGMLVVPTSAVRDEGTSYHYLPPGREVGPSPRIIPLIENVLTAHGCRYALGKTWTTDGVYRETPDRVKRRRDEGCLVVEMEAAAVMAVAQFRGVEIGCILSGADDVSGEVWDLRHTHTPLTPDEKLLQLALEICASM